MLFIIFEFKILIIDISYKRKTKQTPSKHFGVLQKFVMQVFHWSRRAGNYAFLESRDQCLHGRLGSVASYRPVRESR